MGGGGARRLVLSPRSRTSPPMGSWRPPILPLPLQERAPCRARWQARLGGSPRGRKSRLYHEAGRRFYIGSDGRGGLMAAKAPGKLVQFSGRRAIQTTVNDTALPELTAAKSGKVRPWQLQTRTLGFLGKSPKVVEFSPETTSIRASLTWVINSRFSSCTS